MTVGQNIKKRRKELGWTQEQLAKKLNVTKSAICKVETDKEQNMTTDRVESFAEALGCSVSCLMGWEQNEDPSGLAEILASPDVIKISILYSKLTPTNKDFVKSTIEMLIKKQEDD